MTAKEFWEEFELYEEGLRFYLDISKKEAKDHEPYHYLCAQLEHYCDGLEPTLSGRLDGNMGKYTITISCNGDKNLFLCVNRLVGEAPNIPHWKINAFIESKNDLGMEKIMDNPFTFEDFSITPKDIFFTVIAWDPDKDIFDILLLLPLNLANIDDDKLEYAFTIIIQEIWGERFLADKINTLSFISHITSEYDFFELEMLRECLESFE